MRNDQIFVLLLVILLPMSGCFDGAVGDAEGTDDTSSSGTTVINNHYYNNTTNSQERVWYSTGDIVDARWTDGQPYASGAQRCLEFGTSLMQIQENILERCEMGIPSSAEDWNSTNCTGTLEQVLGGGLIGGYSLAIRPKL